MPFLLGVVVLILLLWAGNAFSKADPKHSYQWSRTSLSGGFAVMAAAAGTILFGVFAFTLYSMATAAAIAPTSVTTGALITGGH